MDPRQGSDQTLPNATEHAAEGLLEAVLGYVPVMGPLASVAASKFFEVRRARAEETARVAIEESGAEALLEAFTSSERLQDLVYAAVEAAWRSAMREKRIMLGRAIAQAASDRARLDESEFIVGALRDLDAPHLQTLAEMERRYDHHEPVDGTDYAASAMSMVFERAHGSVRAALRRHGTVDEDFDVRVERGANWDALAREDAYHTSVSYRVSSFGRLLLRELTEEARVEV